MLIVLATNNNTMSDQMAGDGKFRHTLPAMPCPVTLPRRADFLNCSHEGIAQKHRPADAEPDLRAGLTVGSDA